MQNFQYSNAGLALTRQFEGLRLVAYQDSGGVWTVGYGHTGPDVRAGLHVTQAQADALLRTDVAGSVATVNRLVTATITQPQFDALVDFCFNAGAGHLEHSTLLRLVNAADFAGAGKEFAKWVYVADKVSPGLVRRRKAEADLFASGSGGAIS